MNFLEAEQPLVFKTLNNMINKRHVPHALIFYGDKSTSKIDMAVYFSKALFKCYLNLDVDSNVLQRIEKGTHSNVRFVEPGENTLSKSTVQAIIEDASMSSLEDGPKIYIFKDSDKLNQSSSNSLLKFIEEPVDNVYIIFLVDDLSNIIQTIKSRCVLLSFKSLNKDLLIEKLKNEGLELKLINALVEYTQNYDEVRKMIESPDYMEIFDFISNIFMEPFEKSGSMILTLFVLYLKDILNYKVNKSDELIFVEEIKRIKELSIYFSEEELGDFIRNILEFKSKLKFKINFELNMNYSLLRIERIARSKNA